MVRARTSNWESERRMDSSEATDWAIGVYFAHSCSYALREAVLLRQRRMPMSFIDDPRRGHLRDAVETARRAEGWWRFGGVN